MIYSSGAVADAPAGPDYAGGGVDRPTPPPGRGGGAGPHKRKKRRKPKSPLWAKLLIAFGLILAITSVSVITGAKVLLAQATKSVAQQDLLGNEGAKAQSGGHVSINGAQNILLLGLDNRPGQNPDDLVRSDSIIIVHIPADHQSAYMVSIPRDLYLHIPAYPKTHFLGQDSKINAAFAFGNEKGGGYAGGVELLAKTIDQYWGITFNAAAIVDFEGFTQVVNVLGGVDMYVDEDVTSLQIGIDKNGKFASPYKINSDGTINHKIAGVTPVVYHKGYQHLAPWQALDFVRQRDQLPNTDYDRQRHQQQFLKAIFKEILSKDTLTDPAKLAKVLDVVGKAMTVDTGGISIADWIFAMKGITGDSVVNIKTNNGTYHTQVVNGQDTEQLDQTTVDLLASVKNDTVGSFVIAHPSLVVSSTGP